MPESTPEAQASPAQASEYELPLEASIRVSPTPSDGRAGDLPESLLLRNVVWFCRLRWAVVGLFVAFGLAGLFPELLTRLGVRPHREWPFVVAALLAASNLAYLWHARLLSRAARPRGPRANLWAQIVVDLLILTVAVHYVGSLETYVAFTYLFHIVLACIFFPRSWSLAVTALAGALYVACVALESLGVVPAAGINADPTLRDHMQRMAGWTMLNVLAAIVTWFVVWYLASRLSEMVRLRDAKLAQTNRRLLAAQEEKARHMLHTTHELKAPFAAIHANVQLLQKGHCGDLSDDAQDVLARIGSRCRRLAGQIQEMVQLANLRSTDGDALRWQAIDLAKLLEWCVAQARPVAEERQVVIEAQLESAPILAVADHVKILVANLLANAVTYSHPGGRVRVACAAAPDDSPVVTIEDHGIGIAPEKLPHIFEEYYRTDEAVRHNKESTGLGLAIVQHVAQAHGIRVRVHSTPGVGTRVTLCFPTPGHGPQSGEES